MTERTHIAAIAPFAIPTHSLKDFTKARRLSGEDFRVLWSLCGPSAELNLRNGPLWKALCMAYYEGLVHAEGILNEHS